MSTVFTICSSSGRCAARTVPADLMRRPHQVRVDFALAMDPQLERLEAEHLDAVQDAEQLGLVLDDSREQRVAAATAGPEREEGWRKVRPSRPRAGI